MTNPINPINTLTVPSVSITTARTGASAKANELGMRTMQERAYAKRGEQYLLIKSPPASGKSRALMFIALDKLHNQGLQQAIVVVPERSIGGSFADEALTQHGFYWDWTVAPQWNLCNAPGIDEPRIAKSKVEAVKKFLASGDKVLVCTHATFRFAVEELGIQAFDNRLIAVDEFHHVSANPDNKLGSQLGAFIARDKVHLVAMTGSYFRGDSEAVLGPADEGKFETVTYTYYEQLNGYRWLKSLDIGYFFYTGRYVDAVAKVLDPALKTIVHIPSVNSRESLKDKEREVNEIMQALGEWKGIDETTGFHLIRAKDGRTLKVADLVDDIDAAKRSRVLGALKDPAHKNDRDHVDIIIALGMAKEGFDWIWCEHALTIGYPYVTSTWLDNLVTAIESANDALGRPDQLWAILLDELEIVPPALLRTIVDALRSTSNKVRFKLALSPTGSDLIPLGETGSSSSFEDYRPLRLWYERKGDAREFASRLFAVSLKRSADSLKLSLSEDIDVHSLGRLLGVSWSPDSLDGDDDDEASSQLSQTTSEPPSLQRARANAFASLYRDDESFKKLLDDKGIDPLAPPYKDETANGILVRKITQLVVHRDREIGSFTLAEGVKRRGGRRSPWAYSGYPNIIDLTEGNPRWVLTLAEALISAAHSRGRPLSTMSVQSIAINEFVQQMCAKLKVYPTRAAATGRRWTPFDFVEALGLSIAETLFDGPFVTDPRLSFVVDQAAIEQFGEYIRTAIDLGALVIMRKGGPAPLATGGDAQSLAGARVRLTYRLAPEFRLPLLYTKEKKLSLALRSGELLSDREESKVRPPAKRLIASDADGFDDGSPQRRLI